MTTLDPVLAPARLEPDVAAAGSTAAAVTASARLAYLDATRAFALLLGVVFHASLSFTPYFMGWAVQDVSTSPVVADFFIVSHSFRMELFFLLAGFFAYGQIQRQGLGRFVRSRLVRLGLPFAAGWFLLRPLLVSGWIMGAASLRGDYKFWAGIRAGFATLRQLPDGLFTGSHLWFLYYLLGVTGLFVGLRLAVPAAIRTCAGESIWARFRTRLDASTDWLARTDWGLTLLILPTATALWGMRSWGMDTPDQSLRPHLPVLAVYGGLFALGWFFGRRPGAIAAFGRISASRVLLMVCALVVTLKLNGIEADPGNPYFNAARAGFTLGYATLMWTLVSFTLGVFRHFCSQTRPVVRYLADSSYWMYLIHLPVVVWLQVAVADLPIHWSLKLTFVSTVTIALALLTYDLFVRPSLIGQILNGRRRERALASVFRRRI